MVLPIQKKSESRPQKTKKLRAAIVFSAQNINYQPLKAVDALNWSDRVQRRKFLPPAGAAQT